MEITWTAAALDADAAAADDDDDVDDDFAARV